MAMNGTQTLLLIVFVMEWCIAVAAAVIWIKVRAISAAQCKRDDILKKLILAMNNADKKILKEIHNTQQRVKKLDDLVTQFGVAVADSIDEICNDMGDRYSDIFEQYSNLTDVIGDLYGELADISVRVGNPVINIEKVAEKLPDTEPPEHYWVLEEMRQLMKREVMNDDTETHSPLSEVEGMEEADEPGNDVADLYPDWSEEKQAL